MDKKKEKQPGIINAGFSSLLMIFTILCLVTFAALSLVSANRDKKLADTELNNTTAYYSACSQAEIRLAELDSAVKAGDVPSSMPDGWTMDTASGKAVTTIAINDSQTLKVEAIPQASGCVVTRWQTESSKTWTKQDKPNVMTVK